MPASPSATCSPGGYTVFNLEQVDGCRLPRQLEEPALNYGERIERAELIFGALPDWPSGNHARGRARVTRAAKAVAASSHVAGSGVSSIGANE
jgi:hypothetical protein